LDAPPSYYVPHDYVVLSFNVELRNRGPTNVTVQVTASAINAYVGFYSSGGPFNPTATLQTTVDANSGWTPQIFYFIIVKGASNFTISCNAVKVVDLSVPGTVFGEVTHNSFIVSSTYVWTSPTEYERG
jgi:hypothetical protein